MICMLNRYDMLNLYEVLNRYEMLNWYDTDLINHVIEFKYCFDFRSSYHLRPKLFLLCSSREGGLY